MIDPDFCHVLVRQSVNYGWWWLYDGRAGKLTWSTSGNRTLLDLLVRLRPTICQQVVFNIYLLLNSMFEQKTVIKWTQGRASYFTGLSLQTLVVRSPQEPASNFELFFPQVDVLLHWFQLVEEAETRGVPLPQCDIAQCGMGLTSTWWNLRVQRLTLLWLLLQFSKWICLYMAPDTILIQWEEII